MSTLTTTTSVVGVSTIVAHSKFTRRVPDMPKPDRPKIRDMLTAEVLSTLGATAPGLPQTQGSSSSMRHQWQAGKHTIIQEIDVETKMESIEPKGCCHEGLEGRLSGSNKQCARDLPGTENFRSCGDGEHSECSSQAEDCKHHDNSPCDCCRHGHSLTSFMRGSEECVSCIRHMGGAFVSPKYPQMRQRMLKTLNQRRDHSEDKPDAPKVKAEPPVSVKSIPCGKKERLIILNPENKNDNVDDLVRMIEGTKLLNDPKKAAKKARQKERKMQVKFDEDKRQEEMERRMREAEERLKQEQEEREEEERRKAEESKRQARRVKKKNRKKKEAEKLAEFSHSTQDTSFKSDSEKQNDSSLLFSVANLTASTSPSETVRKVLETVKPINDEAVNADKPRMVTIRRHPATHDNQNVVTITLSDDKEGKSPVYMLVNGHLVSTDALSGPVQQQGPPPSSLEVEAVGPATEKRKKKNKKKLVKLQEDLQEKPRFAIPPRDSVSVLPLNDIPVLPTSTANDNHVPSPHSSVDLDNLSLPPGITITKVPSPRKSEGFTDTSVSAEKLSNHPLPTEQVYYVPDDDDFLARKETEEFEEVINKTRRKRMKAARTTTERDGSDETDTRESPNSVKHMTRRPFICDAKITPEKPTESPKVVNIGKGIKTNSKKANSKYADHPNAASKLRRDYVFPSSNHNQVPVMPRLHRIHLKNGEAAAPNYHVPSIYDGRQSYTSVDSQGRPIVNGAVSMERSFTGAPLTSPQQQFLRGNGATSAPPGNVNHPSQVSWTPTQSTATQISHPSCSIQAEPMEESSWNPWKDWSEHSTPDNPSPRFGRGEQFYKENPPPKTYAFHELTMKSKSPIQRPTHYPLDSNFTHLNGSHDMGNFPRDVPAPSLASFQPNSQFENSGEQMFRYQRQQDPSQFASNFPGFINGLPATHPTEQEKLSWSSFSGVPSSAYMQGRPLDKVVLTQSPTHGQGDVTWEPFTGKKSPLEGTAEMLHTHALSPLTLTQLHQSRSSAISPSRYRMGTFDGHAAEQNRFVGTPGYDWQMNPTSARNFSKTPIQLSQQESYNWDLGPTYSRFTGGGAV